jgi:threonine synthase
VKYVSTRGSAPELGFEDVLLTGLARDGGLYVPADWPQLSQDEIAGFAGKSYQDVALAVMRPFVEGEVPDAEFRQIIDQAYATFGHKAVAPLVQLGPNDWLLELFHGPTLAFKDVAMQVLGRLMDRTLKARQKRATIIGATSGDTGGAAIEAFRGRDAIDIFILFPDGRVSDVQRRQMTTPTEENVHAIALEGTFDDCQDMVKALFNDLAFRDRVGLAGVNSINWGRIMAQVVYYFTAAVALGAPHRKVSFTVPTGNFGDIFAGYVAKRMGLPIERLVIATNVNDILVRALRDGRYETGKVEATASPSMDIQVSSNFERLLFDAYGRDGAAVTRLMDGLKQSGSFTIADAPLQAIRAEFDAARALEADMAEAIRSVQRNSGGMVIDPHTAVGIHVAGGLVAGGMARVLGVPMVTLATAHPAKFPAAIEAATGAAPPEPAIVARQRGLPERFAVLPNEFAAVAAFINERSRAAGAQVGAPS